MGVVWYSYNRKMSKFDDEKELKVKFDNKMKKIGGLL